MQECITSYYVGIFSKTRQSKYRTNIRIVSKQNWNLLIDWAEEIERRAQHLDGAKQFQRRMVPQINSKNTRIR